MTPITPQRYRFVVRSAEEAVTVLRERLGPGARVVSVQQVESGGLSRFLQSPKLEVIAEVPAETVPAAQAVEDPGVHLQISPAARRAPAPVFEPAPVEQSEASASPLTRLLRSAGLPKTLLVRLQSEAAWLQWEAASPALALRGVGDWLRQEWRTRRPAPLGQRLAFIGSSGAGKTTALCKQLASDVFCRGRRAVVLKLDLAHANPGDGLAVVCEAFGAVFARDLTEVPDLGPLDILYVDVPGVSPTDAAQTAELGAALEPLALSARILVANAAYEPALLKRSLAWGGNLRCSHAVFTHADELTHWGKFWELVLHSQLTPLFLSTGQNVAGDAEENVFDAVLARTLPQLEEPAQPATAAA